MSAELQDKVVIITGGGRGLGRGAALEMAKAGANIVVADTYRNESGDSVADAVVNEIAALGGRAVASYEDVSRTEGAELIAAGAVSEFGRIDGLVTFAGNAIMKQIMEVTAEDLQSSLNVHLGGTFNCIKAVLPHMVEQHSGRIVTVSSRGAFKSPVPAYSAAKAGIMGLTAAVALEMEMKETGVTVNCLLPSAVTQLFPTTGPRPLGGMPVPLSTDPDDVAPIVAYLVTDEARTVNGHFVYASGGDVCIYADPFQVTWANNILRKAGRWTIAELGLLVQPVVGNP